MQKQVKRRWKFTHLAHQYHATYRTAATDVYWELPSPDNNIDLFAKYEAGGIIDCDCLKNFPSPCPRSAFVTLTNASEFDQALEYQPLVVKEIARRAAMFDSHMVEVPEPVLLQDVVRPNNCQSYQQDEAWPLASLTISCVTQSQLEYLHNAFPDVEMTDSHDADVDSRAADEEPIFEDENNRLETDLPEAEPVDMEVDEGSRGSTFAGDLRRPRLLEQEAEGAHG
eukprot:4253611-Amphidinium_carterae.1